MALRGADGSAPIHALRLHYDAVMMHNKAPLFDTFEDYLASLPVRRWIASEEYVKLVEVPFFARTEDMEMMVSRMETNEGSENARSLVRYGCGQAGCGKTSAVCAAFLRSTQGNSPDKFSHYLYLVFANNNANRFMAIGLHQISEDESTASAQGAGFMLECMQRLLNKEGERHVRIKTCEAVEGQTIESVAAECKNFLGEMIPEGRILVHVDEHRKMASDERDPRKSHYKYFRKGAMSMLALVPSVVVMATFVELPGEIPADASSATCRRAVPIPLLDIEGALRTAGVELATLEGKIQRRLVASLKFRLAATLATEMSTFHLAYTIHSTNNKPMKDVLKVRGVIEAFLGYMGDPGPMTLATLSGQLLDPFKRQTKRNDDKVVEMLLGVVEDDIDNMDMFQRKVSGQLIAISTEASSARLHYSIVDLLTRCPNKEAESIDLWLACSDLFHKALSTNADLLSGTPLERAVLWSLAIMSNHRGFLQLGKGENLKFTCGKVAKGRIFPGNRIIFDVVEKNIAALEKGTLYYADEERKGTASHPIGDIFFRTRDDQLVLIDTTVKPYAKMRDKEKHMSEFAALWNAASPVKDYEGGLMMFIINPLESQKSRKRGHIHFIFGTEAMKALGALAQCMAWYC